MREHNIHNQSEKLGMFGIYFIEDVFITESKNRIQGGFPAWVEFSANVCFFQLPSSVDIQTVNSIFLSCFSNLRFCGFFFFFSPQAHISSPNLELSNAALQALGFCTFNSNNTAELSGKQSNCDYKYIHQGSFFRFFLAFVLILAGFCL